MLQVESEEAEPQPAEGDGNYQIEPSGHGARGELRPRHPEKINQAHEDEPQGDFRKDFGVALQVLGEEQEKRNKKMEDHDKHGDDAPFPVEPRAIEGNLLGLVAGPDDQQLREIKIGPKHDKGEKQFAQVVQMPRLKDARKRFGTRKQHNHGDHERHGGDELPAYKDESINCRSPVRGERHHPINGRETHGENVKNNAGAGEDPEPLP